MDGNERSKVLVTGAFGHIGQHVLRSLMERGIPVRAFDRPGRATRRAALTFGSGVEPFWGDVRNPDQVAQAVEGVEAVLHLAFVLPPASERDPTTSQEVNVGGARNLLAAMEASPRPPRLVCASTYALYGETRGQEELLTSESRVDPVSHYTRQKVEVEGLVRASRLRWCLLRLGAVLCADWMLRSRIDPLIFDLPHDSRHEFVHTEDVARAFVNCLSSDEVWGRTLLIGGGPSCRLRYLDLINRSLGALGIPELPSSAFSRQTRQGGGWMQTEESERLLRYQRWTFDAHLEDIRRKAGVRGSLARAFGPLVRWYLLRQSPYLGSSTSA